MNAPIHRTIPRFTPIRRTVDWDALNRISAYAARCRAEMGEKRWAELNREWER